MYVYILYMHIYFMSSTVQRGDNSIPLDGKSTILNVLTIRRQPLFDLIVNVFFTKINYLLND